MESFDSVQVILAIMQLISGVHLNFKLRHCMSFAISVDDEQVFDFLWCQKMIEILFYFFSFFANEHNF